MTRAVETLYDTDFSAWAESVAGRLRAGDLDGLDFENIAEEIESLRKSEYRGVAASLKVLILHILKWDHQNSQVGSPEKEALGKLGLHDRHSENPDRRLFGIESKPGAQDSDCPSEGLRPCGA